MTTAMPQSQPAPTTTLTAIVPEALPRNPEVLFFLGVEVGDTIGLTYQGTPIEDIDLVYTNSWRIAHAPTTLVVQLPRGWALLSEDENVPWTGSAPIWVGQIVSPLIEDIVNKSRGKVESSFLLYHVKKGTKVDPQVIIRKEG